MVVQIISSAPLRLKAFGTFRALNTALLLSISLFFMTSFVSKEVKHRSSYLHDSP